jgi:penicillin-binding protein 1A
MQSLLRTALLLAATVLSLAVIGLAGISGVYYYLSPGLPSADAIRDVKLQTPLRVYSRDGRLMAQIGEQRRTPVRFEEIPDVVVKAFLAAEDDRFFEHPGFDYQGITRAAFKLATTGERSQGGSTITQQLARAYFLSPERTFIRKAKELILAVRIEQEFTKSEILALYLNKIFLGQRAYGVAAAAEVYFGKPLGELTVAEAATIAGIPKAPSALNPVTNPARAAERRAYVLDRMSDLNFIDEAEYEAAMATPLVSRLHGTKAELDGSYIAEMVRGEMVNRFGPAAYTDGYRVVTTVDSRLQAAANTALLTALLEYDRRHGYRGPRQRDALKKVADIGDEAARNQALQALLERQPGNQHLRPAVVLALGADNSAAFFVRDTGIVKVPWDNLRWRPYIDDNTLGPAPKAVAEMLAPGDVVHLLRTTNRGWLLGQEPQVQGAFVALDPLDGATVALTGGFDFAVGNYNRAVQSRRQPGSSFKPFIYSAALEHGFNTASIINDAPLVFGDSALEDVWRPENYSREFNGPTRMREALVKSLNLVSVRILMGTGLDDAIKHISGFGFDETALPRNLSLALGSGGASPWDMAAGFAAFANGGRRVEHYFIDRIEDAEGNVIFQATPRVACDACVVETVSPAAAAAAAIEPGREERLPGATQTFAENPGENRRAGPLSIVTRPATAENDEVPSYRSIEDVIEGGLNWRPTAAETPHFHRFPEVAPRVISAENAFLVYDMMRDVIQRGTGRRARDLGRTDIAGKTGTSNERRDAWFSGLNRRLVATAWVGFDEDRSLGGREEGGQTALPMWKYFMASALKGVPAAPVPQPPGLITARISPHDGRLAAAGDREAIFEYFRPGDLPGVEGGGPASSPAGAIVTRGGDETDIF